MADWIKKSKRELGRVFQYLGDYEFLEPNFSSQDSLDYAGVELIVDPKVAKGLEEFVNKKLGAKNGFRASLRFIEWAYETKGRLRYTAELIPDQDIPLSEYENTSKEYIQSLPKIIKEFIKSRRY